MKTKALAVLFFLLFCISCDVSTPFVVQGEREYILSSDCGTMVISGSSFSTGMLIRCEFNGNYVVNTELLKIEPTSGEDTITNIRFRLNSVELTGKEIKAKRGDIITLSCNLQSTVPYQKNKRDDINFTFKFHHL
ncbi:MAG: hypothetical protein ACTTH9_05360 [Porphyromonas gingivalis]